MKKTTEIRKSPGEEIWIVLDGLRGEDCVGELCRREGIFRGIYYKYNPRNQRWSFRGKGKPVLKLNYAT